MSVVQAAPRASAIDPTVPVQGAPTTQSVRDNFQAAINEIESLQSNKLSRSGGIMTGPITLSADQILDGGVFP
jgi:hypothetical protein